MAVVETVQELFEVVSSNSLFESARVGNEIEEFSTKGEL